LNLMKAWPDHHPDDPANLQVHDVDGQLEAVLQLLRHSAGFSSVVANQDDMLRGSKLYNVYAVRS
jgi:hypothetical protein